MRALAEAGLRRPGPWSDLRRRALSAALLAPVGLLCLWAGGLAWAALVVLGMAAGGWEWLGMTRVRPSRPAGVALLAGLALGGLLAWCGAPGWGLAVLGGAAVASALLPGGRAALAAGAGYVGVCGVALIVLRARPAGLADTLCLLLVVWASDIGAYLAGRLIGGPRLAPTISPGKTISGALGGLLAAAAAGTGVAAVAGGQGEAGGRLLGFAALVAVALGVASQAGDLFESWAKRRFGVKDSGRLIPGHGGLLDRMDGLMVAGIVAALLALALGRETYLWG